MRRLAGLPDLPIGVMDEPRWRLSRRHGTRQSPEAELLPHVLLERQRPGQPRPGFFNLRCRMCSTPERETGDSPCRHATKGAAMSCAQKTIEVTQAVFSD